MPGHVFVAPGDLTQLGADAVAFSASHYLGRDGNSYASFEANVPGFREWFEQLRQTQPPPLAPGTTFWLPLSDDRPPYGVVLVVATGGQGDLAGLAVRAALTEAVGRLRAAGRTGQILVALPAFRVGRAGDRNQRLSSARAQVAAARDALAGLPDVDVAFITYTAALHQMFLQARREALGPPDESKRHHALESALRAGECVLFVGAGLSSGAGLPGWDELGRRLAADLGIAYGSGVDNIDLAQWHREQFGRQHLGEVVRGTFAPGAVLPTLAHYLLMALPVHHVFTTNYDDLLERALTALKRYPVSVVRQEDVPRTGGAGTYVVKLHGDAAHPDDVVLSRDDYHEFFERRPAMTLLLEGLLLNRTFLFVGYGLRDPNFRQVFSRVARMLAEARRPAFATTFEAGGDTAPYVRRQWRRQQLHLIPIAGADQGRAFLLWLDGLAERVCLRQGRLLLAPDVAASGALANLRAHLERAGAELVSVCVGPSLVEQDVPALAGLLELLAGHGWRPAEEAGAPSLCRLWEALADRASTADERRRLLIHALASAETFADARRVGERLAQPLTGERHETA